MSNIRLKDVVLNFLYLKKEGVYWDFKQEHHKNNVDFIHDVICLANAKHVGDRYLIFGISDDFEIVGFKSRSAKEASRYYRYIKKFKFC